MGAGGCQQYRRGSEIAENPLILMLPFFSDESPSPARREVVAPRTLDSLLGGGNEAGSTHRKLLEVVRWRIRFFRI
jgi:hypothetical protein